MTDRDRINQEVDKTLQSLEGIERAKANPFLYTRIKAKMQRLENSGWEKAYSFISKPVVAIAMLVAVMVINGWVVFSSSEKEAPAADSGTASTSELANQYNLMASTSNYDYENLTNE